MIRCAVRTQDGTYIELPFELNIWLATPGLLERIDKRGFLSKSEGEFIWKQLGREPPVPTKMTLHFNREDIYLRWPLPGKKYQQ